MSLSLYDSSVPVYIQMLTAVSRNLDKVAAFCEAKKIDPAVLLGCRLYPDMFPLMRQVQVAGDNAKGPAARLAGVPVPSYEDNEKTIAELKARIAKTNEFLGTLDRKAFDGAEERDIKFVTSGRERVMKGQAYLLSHALPNFFFHVTTAYAIMRHNGVELGKRDFLVGQPAG